MWGIRRVRRLLAFCCLLIGFASPVLAQTTFTSGDCNANVTISGGGLTLTSTQSGNFVGCRASLGKQSGKLYYEATLNHAPVGTVFGVANGGVGVPASAGPMFSTAAGYTAGNNTNAAVLRSDGSVFWNNSQVTGGASLTSGKTIGLAINLDTDPWQIWVTSDVTSLVCNGSGSSGSTAPKWNGSCANDPTLAGTGTVLGVFPSGATAGTGFYVKLFFDSVWPIWQGQILDSATFNFGATSFAGTVPSGYVSWNNSSGNFALPGPLNPPTINVSDAPGWAATTAYSAGARVNAGAGWNGSTYTNGSAVCLFGLVTPGTSGSSASAFNTACASGTPANTGGIPGGSWPGATTVTDGGATWALLTNVDYATLTNAFNDTSTTWAQSTQYPGAQYIRSNGNIYYQAFTSVCTSASSGSGPTGTGVFSDGSCSWTYLSPLVYSSNANIWNHQVAWSNAVGQKEMQFNYSPKVVIWYGGSTQQVYGPQQPGEGNPLLMAMHYDYPSDVSPYCYHGYQLVLQWCGWVPSVTVAPGDSFVDNYTTGTPLTIDQTKGVTVVNTEAWGGVTGIFYTQGMGSAIAFSDSIVGIDRIQLDSTHGITVPCHTTLGPGNQHCNNIQITNSILRSGDNGFGVFVCDGGCTLMNDAIINRSTAAGNRATAFGYQNTIVANNTIVGTGASNSTCIANDFYFGSYPSNPPGYIYNNLCLGHSFPWSHNNPGFGPWPANPVSAGNATDAPASGYGGTFTDAYGNSNQSFQLPGVGSLTALTAANQVVNPTPSTADLRIKSSSADIYGQGNNYSAAGFAPVTDIIGQTWSPRWDIGPEKFQGGLTATMLRLHMGLGHTW